MKRVKIYDGFNRIWHWAQAILVCLLALTGFNLRFNWGLFTFDRGVTMHVQLALAFTVLIAFAIFWHVTTGAWRQYVPTTQVADMIRFYLVGIFKGEPHPVKKTELSKLNPLQRLTYLGLKILVIPVVVGSGFVYYFYPSWEGTASSGLTLGTVAAIHVLGAYFLMAFMVAHIYLTTTGHTPLSNLKAMITGWEEVEE
jgi:thiosulfate reductase cytochrome b subunit